MDERLHNGGAMAFGNDGKLYITTGDAGKRHNAGTFDDVHGSIIRLNEDGTVPDDNPYTKASGFENSYRCADTEGRVPKDAPEGSYCAEVWANGLRNPFRIDMDPNVKDKVKFSFGVVGAQHIEAIYMGGTDYKGTNYGWPKYEGVCRPGDIFDCEPNENPDITMPFHWYEHISYEDGGCIGGQVHVPEGIWPSEFKYLFIDFILLQIYSLELDRPDLACEECSPPLPPTRNETFFNSIQKEGDNINEARLVDMWFGPYKDTQAMYFTKFGNHDTVIRIRYNGILNKPPKPAFDYQYDGEVAVNFDAWRTTDAEGDDLKYEWDFGDDSDVQANKVVASHLYSQPGEYVVTLKVTDTSGQEQQVSETIKIGTPPTVNIVSPAEGAQFAVGQVLRLQGEAFDFWGNPIPDEQLTWEVRQHHADHFHPFLDLTDGNDFDLYPAPDPEDYLAATNSFLKVVLTAEDEYGLSETVSVDVQPNIIMVNVTTQPPGLDIVVDGFNIETPELITSWKGFKLPVTVADQPPFLFKGWSDGRIARDRKFPMYQKMDELVPQVQAIFCTDLAAQCENHSDCCSGYCSVAMNGMCAPMPKTLAQSSSPSSTPAPYFIVSDPPASDLEIDVVAPPHTTDTGEPLDLYDEAPEEELSISNNTSISVSLNDNNNDGASDKKEEIMDIVLEYAPYAAIVVALLVLVWFIATCKMCKRRKKRDQAVQYKPYSDDESESDLENGSNEYYNGGRSIKASETGSTEESDENPSSHSSPVPDENACNNSQISLSFLVPGSSSSENENVDDIENQDGAVAGEDLYLLPPLSPSPSLQHPKIRNFDEPREEQSLKVEGMLEYRFDAASTSQSSLILPPQSVGLDQESFDGVVANQSVSLTIPSPQKDAIKTIPVTKIVEESKSLSESDSSDDRDLGETSAVIESLVLSYFSEKAVNEDAIKDDTSASGHVLPPIADTSDVTDEEDIDEDDQMLELLLSADIEEKDLLEMSMDKEFLKNCPEDLTCSFAQNDSENEKQDEEKEEVIEFEETDSTDASTENEVRSAGPTKLTEESSILSQLCVASTAEEAELPVDISQFLIDTITHENSNSVREVDLSPLKSPNTRESKRATEMISFMSPEGLFPQKQTEETPETLAMDDANLSVDTNESEMVFSSKATGMNLQSTFAASAFQEAPVTVSQQENEANK